ncbi:hypothetical protein EBZ37_03230 [bacterium]|nr:hypothetical protein [bacterium]
MIIMGIMTGTSCDGLDSVNVEFSGGRFKVLSRASKKYPAKLRRRVLEFQATHAEHSSREWVGLNKDLGLWYASSALEIIRSSNRAPDVIANHGQTLAHFPGLGTLQLGDPAIISEKTGLTVVSQFRTGDVAAGGQGAPLAPRFHEILAKSAGASKNGCSIHNLGGISNLTYIHDDLEIRAWDTGPANLWIDLAVQRSSSGKMLMDKGGTLARLGTPDKSTVSKLLRHPFFKKRPPKSTGRDDFSSHRFYSHSRNSQEHCQRLCPQHSRKGLAT